MAERANERALLDELAKLEEQGWKALKEGRGAEFHEHNLADSTLMVFSFGVLDRDESVKSVRQASPWASFTSKAGGSSSLLRRERSSRIGPWLTDTGRPRTQLG